MADCESVNLIRRIIFHSVLCLQIVCLYLCAGLMKHINKSISSAAFELVNTENVAIICMSMEMKYAQPIRKSLANV